MYAHQPSPSRDATPLAYTPAGAAAALQCSRQHIYNLMAAGHLRSVKIGNSRRIPADALNELLATGTPSAGGVDATAR